MLKRVNKAAYDMRMYIVFAILLSLNSLAPGILPFRGWGYVVYILFILYFYIRYPKKKYHLRRYMIYLACLLMLFLVNYIVSPYSSKPKYFIVGSFFTIIPFLTFLVTQKMNVTQRLVQKYVRHLISFALLLAFAILVETVITGEASYECGALKSNVFGLGFVSSFFNQILVLSLIMYHQKRKKRRYLYFALFMLTMVLLSIQIKAIVGSIMIVSAYFLILVNLKRVVRYCLMTVIVGTIIFLLSSNTMFMDKLSSYRNMYTIDTDGIARVQLYVASFEIASDFFPLGTGQGTFGSVPVNEYDSKVYDDYYLSGVYGLNDDYDVNFKLDTHWASVIGEQGILGFLVYFALFIYPIVYLMKSLPKGKTKRIVAFFIVIPYLSMILESLVLPLPNRFCFIFIYSALSSMIVKLMKSKQLDKTIFK